MATQVSNVRVSETPFIADLGSVVRDTGHLVDWDAVPPEAPYLAENGRDKIVKGGTPVAKGDGGVFPIPFYRFEIAAAGTTPSRVDAQTVNIEKTGIRDELPGDYTNWMEDDGGTFKAPVFARVFPKDSGVYAINRAPVLVEFQVVDADNVRFYFEGAPDVPDPLPTLEDPIIVEPAFFGFLEASAIENSDVTPKTGFGVIRAGNLFEQLLPFTPDSDFEKENVAHYGVGRFLWTPYVDNRV